MLNKIILVVFALLVIVSGIYALRDDKEYTTSSDEAHQLYLEAEDLAYKLYFMESSDKLHQALRLDSNFAMALITLAQRHNMYGHAEKRDELVERTMAQYDRLKDYEKAYIDIVRTSFEGDPEEIHALIKKYVQRFPERVEGRNFLAISHWERGEIEKAIDEYEKLLEIDPGFTPAYNHLGYLEYSNGNFNKALRYFDKYLQLLPDQANPHDSRGEILMAVGRYDEALDEFKTAYQIEPQFDFVLYHMAEAYMAKGMYSKADQIFRRIGDLVREPQDSLNLMVNVGRSYWRRWDPEMARIMADSLYQFAEKRESLQAARFWGDVTHGFASLLDKDYDEAEKYLIRAREFTGKSGEKKDLESSVNYGGWIELLQAYINIGRENYEEVLVLEDLLENKQLWRPDQKIDTRNILAQAYLKLGQKERAFDLVQENLDLNPNQSYTLITLARLYEWDGQTDKAAETLRNILTGVYANADQDAPRIKKLQERLAELTPQAAEL
ncbi:MAG: tetratricopeptide repeat protein [candidate division Zixibacteria bacterium]|nr:tetratricopeptide repeat protein [candidate division Zixibacteria bacterium]NIR64447.1 tetratricopeptide repeat protein [candidate division Zixibacteria bacterium]NIS16443.1 tetratricopeptide repeat protein [candidate division Zixibacteria bacterium]NIS46360.1 tetratricopeptide repeat protein [candidate division Zixibacteria bacterium]NIT52800.1 tetratricopeptide repeat protein [candidate division Zixibacteria bacterium]